ncbi:hypothetical protein EDD27_9086 [Nonomuraea polychroma]|uniref:Uncharacterized protein n=1 Tax=Nonomuraea polychroma TaxID=46176 RepID=A0A438MK14_9ACTN|nr:hypothetical protein [Nonomuraea polychroma]RVX46227.1 hypothetical protein EDD27_9086 [Nonomuraea polychroma]
MTVLAVLICPAPEDHKAVRDGALLPSAKEGLLKISRERLEQVFPAVGLIASGRASAVPE